MCPAPSNLTSLCSYRMNLQLTVSLNPTCRYPCSHLLSDAQGEDLQGVTEKQECNEISEDCAAATGNTTGKEPAPGGQQWPGCLHWQRLSHRALSLQITGHSELLDMCGVNKHRPAPIWLPRDQDALAC